MEVKIRSTIGEKNLTRIELKKKKKMKQKKKMEL